MRDKIFFFPGDVVTIRQDIANKPTMLVVKKVTKSIRTETLKRDDLFQGILCRWFSGNQELQEGIFNTKDLIKL